MKRLPLISEKKEKKIAKDLCDSIALKLTDYYSSVNSPGLLNGLGGISLFFFHYYRFSGKKEYQERAYSCLEMIIGSINEGYSNPSFASGLAGVHWLFNYLGKMKFIGEEEAGVLSGLNSIYLNYAIECFDREDYDYLHGGLGMAMNHPDPLLTKLIVNKLDELSVKFTNDSKYWNNTDLDGKVQTNFGLAHGIPSIMSISGKLYKAVSDRGILENIINPGMNFIFKFMDFGQGDDSVLPTIIQDEKPVRPSRLAWCYGDPGAAAAIYQTGLNCSRRDWQDMAVKILLHSSKRRSNLNTRVEDACLCHGSSGLALIFYKAWLLTGHQEFYDCAAYWLSRTIDYSREKFEFLFKGSDGFEPKYNMLEGIAGVGLSMLAFMEVELPGWEKALLIN